MTPETVLYVALGALVLAFVITGLVAGVEMVKQANADLDQLVRERQAALNAERAAANRREEEKAQVLREYGDRLLGKAHELRAQNDRLFDRTLGYDPAAIARMADPDSPEYDVAVEFALNRRRVGLAYERAITPAQAAELKSMYDLPSAKGGA